MSTTIGIWVVGVLTLAAMVGHCVPTVFNRKLPKGGTAWLLTSPRGWSTLARFMWLLNPLEIVWRFATGIDTHLHLSWFFPRQLVCVPCL